MVIVRCKLCGTEKFRYPSDNGVFCSQQCYRIFRLQVAAASLKERYWSFLDRGRDDECWTWRGAITSGGYGNFGIKRNTAYPAHRFAWEIAYGPIPGNLSVLHSCDNRPCCNPKHLFLGTQKDNTEDMVRKGRAKFWGWPDRKYDKAIEALDK